MTTMPVVDVESIVGDIPAQACEFLDFPCDQQATWGIRVHIAVDRVGLKCSEIAQTVCDQHLSFIRKQIRMDKDVDCAGCGKTTGSCFHAVRL